MPANPRTGSSAARSSGRGSRRCERSSQSDTSSPSSRPAAPSRSPIVERQALGRLARDLPRLWEAETTTPRDRKELLRTLICEVVVTVKEDPRRAEVEIVWEGGARTELQVPLEPPRARALPHQRGHRRADRTARRAQPDEQIAAILNKQGRLTGTGLPFNQSRVKHVRQKHGIAASPPDPDSDVLTIQQAAAELGVSAPTIYRWLRDGLLPGEQTTPHAPWRIRLTDEIRARFVPDVPDGYLPLDEAASASGAPGRPFCTRSNAANLTPSKSSTDGEKA